MAMPVIKGEKTESERFPGAVSTYAIESMMQDRKALQSGTSHFLGQNFAKASGIKFLNKTGKEEFAWTTSWGVSTRLIGGLIMTHADDDGMVIPPKLAPFHIVILPVVQKTGISADIHEFCKKLLNELQDIVFHNRSIAVKIDNRDVRGGEKFWIWVKKGIPVRIEIGPREVETDTVSYTRRDKEHTERRNKSRVEFIATVKDELNEIQNDLLTKAREYCNNFTIKIDSKNDFYDFFSPRNKEKPEIHGGFALSHWSGEASVEEKIKNDLNVTIRSIPLNGEAEEGKCILSGKPSKKRVIFAKAY
jgi:prolyl-tRNA synthetase